MQRAQEMDVNLSPPQADTGANELLHAVPKPTFPVYRGRPPQEICFVTSCTAASSGGRTINENISLALTPNGGPDDLFPATPSASSIHIFKGMFSLVFIYRHTRSGGGLQLT